MTIADTDMTIARRAGLRETVISCAGMVIATTVTDTRSTGTGSLKSTCMKWVTGNTASMIGDTITIITIATAVGADIGIVTGIAGGIEPTLPNVVY